MIVEVIKKKFILGDTALVQNDNLVDSVTFRIDRFYKQKDLGYYNAYLLTENEEGLCDKIPLAQTIEKDKLLLLWNVSRNQTYHSGKLNVQLSFEDNENDLVFNTFKGCIDVGESILADKQIEEKYPTILSDFQKEMQDTLNKAEDSIERGMSMLSQAIENGSLENVDIDGGFVTKIKEQNKNKPIMFWFGSRAEYDAIELKQENTLYFFTDENDKTKVDAVTETVNKIIEGVTKVGASACTYKVLSTGKLGDSNDNSENGDRIVENVFESNSNTVKNATNSSYVLGQDVFGRIGPATYKGVTLERLVDYIDQETTLLSGGDFVTIFIFAKSLWERAIITFKYGNDKHYHLCNAYANSFYFLGLSGNDIRFVEFYYDINTFTLKARANVPVTILSIKFYI